MGHMFTPALKFRALLLGLFAVCAVLLPDLVQGQGAVSWSTATTSSSGTYLSGATSRRNQVLYPAAELTGALSGSITKIYFRRSATATNALSMANLQIRMGQTANTAFPNNNLVTGLTTVFTSTTFTQGTGTIDTWFSITLDSPFPYNATQSLIIETEYTGTPTNGISVRSTSTSTPLRRLTSAGNTALPYSTATTGTTSGFIPAFSFDVSTVTRDAAPINVVSSPAISSLMCSGGSTALSATIQNVGSNAMTSVKFNWFINDVLQGNVSATGLNIAQGASTDVSLGNYTLPASLPRNVRFKFVITEINGTTDQNAVNDSYNSTFFKSGYSGTISAGSGGTFPTIQAAIDSLNARGLCGATTLNIKPGTYTGQYQLNALTGSSAANRLTIKPESGTVTLAFDASTTGNNYILSLNGADYVTVQGLTFDRSAASVTPTLSRILDISGGSDYAIVTGNTFNGFNFGTGATTNAFASIYSNTSTDLATTIANNTFNYNGSGIALSAVAATDEGGHTITGNTINTFYYGIYLLSIAGGATISDNVINRYDQTPSATLFQGLVCSGVDGRLQINNNTINTYTSGYGIYLTGCEGLSANRSKVYNNFASVGGTGTAYALSTLGTTNNVDIFFNNFRAGSSNVTAASHNAWYNTTTVATSAIVVRNNNFAIYGTAGYAVYISNATGGTGITTSNNNFYSTTAQFAFYAAAVADLAALNSTSGNRFPTSFTLDPDYVSATNLHIQNSNLAFKGVSGTGITTDFDGQTRDASQPTIGADEIFPVVRDIAVTSVELGLTSLCGSGSTPVSFSVTNAGLSPVTQVSVTYFTTVNGVEGTGTTQVFSGLSLATGASTTLSFTTPMAYASTGSYQVRVTSGAVNGESDQVAGNNTARSITTHHGFSGILTMNPGAGTSATNFTSMQGALDSLVSHGLCGATTLNISAGTYTGQYLFAAIPGSSVDNKLLIKPASGTVTLAFDAGIGGQNYILAMNGADYVTIQNIVFDRSNYAGTPTLSRCLDASNGTDYLTVTGCTFNGFAYTASATSNLTASIFSNVSIDLETTITNCTFNNNGYGVSLNGIAATLEGPHVVTGNTVSAFSYGLYFASMTGGVTASNNIIDRYDQTQTTSFYGMYFTAVDGKILVQGNKINGYTSGYGIYMTNCDGIPADKSVVANNQISYGGAGTVNGIYTLGSTANLDILFNNIRAGSSTATASSNVCYYQSATTGTTNSISVHNNNFVVSGTNGYTIYVSSASTSGLVVASATHNNLFTTTANYAFWGAAVADLAALNTASSNKFTNVISVDPGYASNDDLTSSNLALALAGKSGTGITTDYANVSRNATSPTIGATELFPPTDDAGVTAIDPSLNVVCANGSSTLSFTVINQGLASLTSVRATYYVTVNGVEGTGVVQNFTGLNIPNNGGTAQLSFTTPWAHTYGSYYQFRVVTSLPNGSSDFNAANNELTSRTYRPAFLANATVNPGLAQSATNFQSIQIAFDSLAARGICGNTTLTITPGTYTGKVQLRDIPGAGSGARLTILGGGTTPSQTLLTQPGSTTSGSNWVFSGLGIRDVTIQKLSFERTGDSVQTFSTCMDLSGGVSNVLVNNCNFQSVGFATASTTGNSSGVFSSSASIDSDVTIQNSFFNGVLTGVHWAGISAASPDPGLHVLNNVINNGNYGIYLTGCTNPDIAGNKIRRTYQSRTSITAYGIYMTTGANGSDLQRNEIRYYGGTIYGIYYTGVAGTSTNPNNLVNNYVYATGTGANYLIYHSGLSHYLQAYHNTIVTSTVGSNYGYYGLSSTATNITFNNNLFVSLGSAASTQYPFYIAAAGVANITSARNNTIYNGKPGAFGFFGAINADMAAFVTAGAGKTDGTTSINPLFLNEDSYQFTNPALDGSGLTTLGINTDIEGNTRTGALDNGAYEFTPPARDVNLVSLVSEHLCIGGNQPVVIRISDVGTDNVTSVRVNWSVNGVSQPQANITGLSMTSGSSTNVTLGNYTFAAGTYTIDATVAGVNGSNDQNPLNDALATATVVTVGNSAMALPYVLDLESTTVTTGIPTFWTADPIQSGTAYRWAVGEGPLGSASSGPNVDNTLGTALGNYLYTTAANGVSGDVATFTSDCINLGSINTPAIRFFYHRYGATSPVLNIDVYHNGSWINGVYTMTGQDPQQTAATSAWKQVTVPLGTYSGVIKIRFRAIRGTSTTGETAIDDIRIFDGSVADLTLTAITRASTSCPTTNETIQMTVQNLSSNAHNFALRPATFVLTATGAATFSRTIVWNGGTLAAGATSVLNVFANVNGTAAGTYTFSATMALGAGQDDNPTNNNAASPLVLVNAGTQALPVFFNGGRFTGANLSTVRPGWSEATGAVPAGTTSSWLQGTAFTGDTVVRVNLVGATKREWLFLPRINASANTKLRFRSALTNAAATTVDDHNAFAGTDDFVEVRVSTDCGTTWTGVYTMNEAWQNANSVSNAFKPFTVNLAAYAGRQLIVAFFASEGTVDNINSYDVLLDDIALTDNDFLTWTGAQSNVPTNKYNWTPWFAPQENWICNIANATTKPTFSTYTTVGGFNMATGGTVNFTGNPAIRVLHNFSTTSDVYTINGGYKLIVSGNTAQSIGTRGRPLSPLSLTINNPAGVTLTSEARVTDTLNLYNGVFNLNNNKLTMVSTATGTARISPITSGSLSNASNFTYQRYIAPPAGNLQGGWYFVGTGVNNNTVNAWANRTTYSPSTYLPTGSSQLWLYDNANNTVPANNGWVKPTGPTQVLAVGQGARFYFQFYFWTQHGGVYETKGVPHTGNYNFTPLLNYCTSGCAWTATNGWSLLANPYVSTINWDSPSWTRSGAVANEVKVWNNSIGNYASYVAGVGTLGGSNLIASGQGFMVRALSTITSNDLVATEGVKVTSANFLRQAALTQIMRINIKDAANHQDEAVVRLVPGATSGYDPALDATYLEGTYLNVYTAPRADTKLSINALDVPTSTVYVPMGLKTSELGTHTMTFSGLSDWAGNYQVYLDDNYLGTRRQLQEGSIVSFNVSNVPATTGLGRFTLVMMPGAVTALPTLNPAAVFTAYPNPGKSSDIRLMVSGMGAGKGKVMVTDVVGKVVATQVVDLSGQDDQAFKLSSELSSGIYHVSIQANSTHKTIKLVVE